MEKAVFCIVDTEGQATQIADALCSTKQCQLLGVKIEDDANLEPFRLFHLASALYVSAYLRKDRRAISIALACFGS